MLSRRAFVGGACCLCGLGHAGAASARISPAAMQPLIGRNHKPEDADEKGMWDRLERVEQDLKSSNLIVRDQALTEYLSGVAQRVLGDQAADLRLYLVRSASFNAGMYPNGMMIIHTGLLTRLQDEAQLAGVIGHEAGHYLRRHSVRQWRDLKRRTAAMNFISIGVSLGGIAAGVGTRDLVYAVNNALFFGAFAYGRTLETEADAFGLKLVAGANYSPLAMSRTWEQFIGEEEASARMRKKRPDRGYSLLSTHPAPAERMMDLKLSATELSTLEGGDDGRSRFQAAVGPHQPMLLDDQIKLNDPGASLYLLDQLAAGGWNGLLRYSEGEVYRLRGDPGDAERARDAYAQAIALPDAPAEAWRAHGYALLKQGQGEAGKRALARYLELKPGAPDAAMVRYSLTN